MTTPKRPGDAAPDFRLPAVNRPGSISLADFKDKSGLLLGLYRGLHCPFCRRQIVQLSELQPALDAVGVTTVAVVNTPRDRAELYFRYHAVRILVVADPDARTHAAFGVPRVVPDASFAEARINPTGELPEPVQPLEANVALNKKDNFTLTKVDEDIFAAHGTQLAAHFLIDRAGLVRWTSIEAEHGVRDIGRFPSAAETLAAARALAR